MSAAEMSAGRLILKAYTLVALFASAAHLFAICLRSIGVLCLGLGGRFVVVRVRVRVRFRVRVRVKVRVRIRECPNTIR